MATIACLLWGSAFPTIKICYKELGIGNASSLVKLQFAGYRFLLASLFLGAYVAFKRKSFKLSSAMFKKVLLLGILQTTLQYLFFFVGVSNTTGVKASIMVSLEAFFAIMFPHFYYDNDKLSLNKWMGLFIGFAGIIYINLAKGSINGGFSFSGEGMMLMAAVFGAISAIYAKELSTQIDILVMTFYQMFIGSSLMIILSTTFIGGNAIPLQIEMMPLFIYLALISSVAFAIWFTLLNHNSVSKVSIYKFQVPIWGSLLSAFFISSESLSLTIIVGLISVSLGIVLVNYTPKVAISIQTNEEDKS